MFSADGPERRDRADPGAFPLDDLVVEVEEGEALEAIACRVGEHRLERTLGDRPSAEPGDHRAQREVRVVRRHGNVGREHAAEADAEGLLDDDDSSGSGQRVGAPRRGGRVGTIVIPTTPTRSPAIAAPIDGVFDRAEDRSECDDDRLGVFGPVGVEQAAAVAPEGVGEFARRARGCDSSASSWRRCER